MMRAICSVRGRAACSCLVVLVLWSGVCFAPRPLILSLFGMPTNFWWESAFLRILWLHLTVVWAYSPGTTFVAASTAVGIFVPFAFLGATFGTSGFAYRFSSTCIVKNEHSFVLFWGWLVGFACISLVLQLIATGYCIWIYVDSHRLKKCRSRKAADRKNLSKHMKFGWLRLKKRDSKVKRRASSTPPIESGETNPNLSRKRDLWRGIRDVITLQWRSIVLCIALVIQGLYFSSLSWASERRAHDARSDPRGLMFGRCLVFSGGDKQRCFPLSSYILINRRASLAAFGALSVCITLWLFLSSHNLLVL
jgi:hypothetical protein